MAIASLSSPSQGMIGQLAQRQAQSTADQAEQKALNLQREARQAQQEADRAEQRANALKLEARQANRESDQARREMSSLQASANTQKNLNQLRDELGQVISAGNLSQTLGSTTNSAATLSLSALGSSATGTLIDVSA